MSKQVVCTSVSVKNSSFQFEFEFPIYQPIETNPKCEKFKKKNNGFHPFSFKREINPKNTEINQNPKDRNHNPNL